MKMLSLDSPQWSELTHAYGFASDIPALLHALKGAPDSSGNDEPWFSIWSALAHQGDVYPATFAAIPHVIRVIGQHPTVVSYVYFQFPAWVEICRVRNNTEIPADLSTAYFEALRQIPNLAAGVANRIWDADFAASVLAAVAASKNATDMAAAVLDLDSETLPEFRTWFDSR